MAKGSIRCYILFLMLNLSQLHMIENRLRIERQILLGRQAVRHSYRGRTGTPGAESRCLTEKNKQMHEPNTTPAAIATSSTISGFEAPLSADTDAEAAFALRSPFKRRHSSKHLLLNRAEDLSVADSPRRRTILSESPEGSERDSMKGPAKASNSENQSPGFLSKLGASSLSRLSLPFAYDLRAMNRSDRPRSFTSSSESSSEASYSWDLDQSHRRSDSFQEFER